MCIPCVTADPFFVFPITDQLRQTGQFDVVATCQAACSCL